MTNAQQTEAEKEALDLIDNTSIQFMSMRDSLAHEALETQINEILGYDKIHAIFEKHAVACDGHVVVSIDDWNTIAKFINDVMNVGE